MDVNDFAQLVLEQTKDRLATQYPTSPQWEWEKVEVVPGPKYTKVNIGPQGNLSGKYMVENATDIIYGIKGYGKVHKGHVYGTLDTVHDWYWGDYAGVRRTDLQPVDPELFKRTAPKWNCVHYPNDGPHYISNGNCAWCGKTCKQIAAEYKQGN